MCTWVFLEWRNVVCTLLQCVCQLATLWHVLSTQMQHVLGLTKPSLAPPTLQVPCSVRLCMHAHVLILFRKTHVQPPQMMPCLAQV